MGRDRDAQGRAESARPRDRLGRPLPYGSVGVERVATGPRAAHEALAQAQGYLDRDMPFHAHEVLEERWKCAPEDERALWQGLAQLAVGLTHHRRGNLRGAASVTGRGARAVSTWADQSPYGIDIVGVLVWADALLTDPTGEVPTLQLGPGGATG